MANRAGGGGGDFNPRHGRGGGGGGQRSGGGGRPSRMSRTHAIQTALGNVRNAFMEEGHTPQQALHFAQILLSRPHVVVGRGGTIRYQGQTYNPQAFTTSALARYVTGQRAQALNRNAILSDPGYQQALAQLALNRDTTNAGVDDTRRQQLIQFGDPSLVQGDALTAGAAQANPFSTVSLLQRQNQQQQQATQATAQKYGTYYGGGLQSGMGEAQRAYAGNMQNAYTKLQQLLGTLSQQEGASNAQYGVGQQNAYQTAYQNLLASGALHAAHAPNLQAGKITYRVPGAHPGAGGGGGGGNGFRPVTIPGAPQNPVTGPAYPTQPGVGMGQMPGGITPPIQRNVPPLPSMQSYLSRYGLTPGGV